MFMMNYVEQREGNIFFIPLFIPNDNKPYKSFSRKKFNPNDRYAFGRLIDDVGYGGDHLIEIFKYTFNHNFFNSSLIIFLN